MGSETLRVAVGFGHSASYVVYRGAKAGVESRALRPGVNALPLQELLGALR